mmetsp:Transcript_23447/g.34992  ORF Transcript_23447/g.34992 Transcript_23447/m.34992 type:complete len:242 (-) Transcript_23447:490-1215(-)
MHGEATRCAIDWSIRAPYPVLTFPTPSSSMVSAIHRAPSSCRLWNWTRGDGCAERLRAVSIATGMCAVKATGAASKHRSRIDKAALFCCHTSELDAFPRSVSTRGKTAGRVFEPPKLCRKLSMRDSAYMALSSSSQEVASSCNEGASADHSFMSSSTPFTIISAQIRSTPLPSPDELETPSPLRRMHKSGSAELEPDNNVLFTSSISQTAAKTSSADSRVLSSKAEMPATDRHVRASKDSA